MSDHPFDDEEYERQIQAVERTLAMTDEEVKALGLKEYKPGYFYNDPRYSSLGPEDRWLYDHPGTPKKITVLPKKVPRDRNRDAPKWDEGQFAGGTLEDSPAPSLEYRRVYPTPPGETVHVTYQSPEGSRTTYGLWLCQVCRNAQAQWPSEIGWQKMLFGVRFTVIVRAPYACTDCRIMRFREQQSFGHRDHRFFWQNVIALVTGESMLKTVPGIQWINRWRSRFFGERHA